jgi:hypothetical protein
MRRRSIFEAFREFFIDLAAGDPVAISILLGMLAFLVVLGLLGWWILSSRKREEQRHRDRLYGKYKKVDGKPKPDGKR